MPAQTMYPRRMKNLNARMMANDRREIFKHLEDNRGFFRKLIFWGLLIGLSGSALHVTLNTWHGIHNLAL